MQFSPIQLLQISPMGIGILTLIVGLGVYLRHVAEAARTMRNEILAGLNAISWPPEAEYTTVKIKALAFTWNALNQWAAPILIFLGALSSGRLFAQAVLPIVNSWWQALIIRLIPWCDAVVFGVIALGFVGLGIMHQKAKKTEALISELRLKAQPDPAYLSVRADR